jgi:hypothetical protein
LSDALVSGCRFEGEEDGESALKECRRVTVERSYFDLRYPFWHGCQLSISECEMTKNCRAALWYSRDISVEDSRLGGIKALRECRDICLDRCDIESPEFGWRSRNITLTDTEVNSEYAFFEARGISADRLRLAGKYSFQYVENVRLANSTLRTKDAFWHARNVTVTDSELRGEYLGWYSEGLTLIRCHISGTQPFCYCRRLRLIDCTMDACDLSFEYSDVRATVRGRIDSVKNPRRGSISADEIGEIIREGSVVRSRCRILTEAK